MKRDVVVDPKLAHAFALANKENGGRQMPEKVVSGDGDALSSPLLPESRSS